MSQANSPRRSRRTLAKLLEALEHRRLLASPIVITKGGTYSGTWESADPRTPAVLVKTTEPVTIENAIIRGKGDLIASGVSHTNITVRGVKGFGLNPNVYGRTAGEWVSVENFDNLLVEGSYFEHGTGINLLNYAGDRTAAESVRIVGNTIRNVDGRKSDGSGGYLDFNTRKRKSDGVEEDGFDYAQFVQFDKVIGVPNVEIGWNSVVNEAGNSRVEDVISLYKSSGTAAGPIRIHDNYIQGAYTIKPWQGNTSDATYDYDWGFSGGGIMLGDGVGSTPEQDPAFVKAFGNTVVSTTNYGIALSAGHDLEAYGNRVLSAGVLPDGRAITAQNVGIYVWDSYKAGAAHFFNNTAHDNVSGWVQGTKRNDWWSPVSGAMFNNTHWAGTVTTATEQAERNAWQARLEGGGSTPVTPTTPTAPTAPTAPTTPTAPSTPTAPTAPTAPPEPAPTVPTAPAPATPSEPVVPATPVNPAPTTPTEPTAPVDPAPTIPSEPPTPPSSEPTAPVDLAPTTPVDPPPTVPVDPVPTPPVDPAPTTPIDPAPTVPDAGGPVQPIPFDPPPAEPTAPLPPVDAPVEPIPFDPPDNGGPAEPPVQPPVEPEPVTFELTGIVFADRDGDGVRDRNERGIAGRTVYQDANGNARLDAGEASDVTDKSGKYVLTVTESGHAIRQVLPSGWYGTTKGTGIEPTLARSAAADASALVNLGTAQYARIGGNVFRDANADGRRDADEGGLSGWTVYLDANNNGWRDANERTAITDASGDWTFEQLKPGVYNVRIQQNDRALQRTTASYFKHAVTSGSSVTKDAFGYA
ncbi:MAG TPA: SdrD B-like domain-containing protein [Tepidisphaeraceae bacterium]|nr:SdrD B-like domain-containing protein [Tepidisphaeraceae bacterium]